MNKITETHAVKRMILLFTALYLISYVTRINYGAVIAELVSAEGIQKSLASLALTASAVTYGAGQLISGFLGDRIEPKKLIFSGLLVTIFMNLLIPFCRTPYQMTAVWGINGMAQAFMWPPLVKIMTVLFTEETYKKACVIVSWGSSCGTILVYLLSPVCIYFAGWRAIFVLSALCAAVMAAIWLKKCPGVKEFSGVAAAETQERKPLTRNIIFLLPGIMLAIALQGMLRDGVTTWMPSYISETFHLSSKISILTGVVLPVFSIVTFQVTSLIYRKKVRNELLLSGILYLTGFTAALVLALTNGANAGLSVFLTALLTGSMHGVNLILVCMVPPYFKRFGRISFASGMLNFCTYVGSAVSTFGMAVFSERFGWNSTVFLWSTIALFGGGACLAISKGWGRFAKEA